MSGSTSFARNMGESRLISSSDRVSSKGISTAAQTTPHIAPHRTQAMIRRVIIVKVN
jgi:hypothetical protein